MDAEQWLAREYRLIELHNLGERAWTPPKARVIKPVKLIDYAEQWNRERKIQERTRVEYERYRTKHLGMLSNVVVGNITDAAVRSWWAGLDSKYERRNSQVYSWLKAVMNTAVTDGLLPANPCNIRGGNQSTVKREAVILDVPEVAKLAAAIPAPSLRLSVLVMAWCTCRYGEMIALQRRDVEGAVLHVRAGVVRVGKEYVRKETKTGKGRVVAIPPHIVKDFEDHLKNHVGPDPDALLFPAVGGDYLNERVYRKQYFDPAAEKIGRKGLVPHDLRKFAGTQNAKVGTLAENMSRMGHSTVKASMIYQKAVSGRDAEVAVELSKLTGWTPPEG